MGFAEASESTIYVGKTTSEGTEPTTYDTITPTGHDLSTAATQFTGEDIDPAGTGLDSFRKALSGSGSINAHWRPLIFDSSLECGMRSTFTAANSETETIDFSTPTLGLQTVTDNAAGGTLTAGFAAGDAVVITGAGDATNNGTFMVTAINSTDQLTIYNPAGVTATGDTGVSLDHNGTLSLGTTGAWAWVERVMSDGSQLIYSEFFSDCVVAGANWSFPAGGPSRFSLNLQGDPPAVDHSGPPITKQRGGSDNSASTERLVHGMEDVTTAMIYNSGIGVINLKDKHNLLEFGLSRDVRQDEAVGTSSIINTGVTRPTLSGRINAYLDSGALGTGALVDQLLNNPDGLGLYIVAGSTAALSYGWYLNNVRFQAAPTPIGGNNAAVLINSQFTATTMKVTRIAT